MRPTGTKSVERARASGQARVHCAEGGGGPKPCFVPSRQSFAIARPIDFVRAQVRFEVFWLVPGCLECRLLSIKRSGILSLRVAQSISIAVPKVNQQDHRPMRITIHCTNLI